MKRQRQKSTEEEDIEQEETVRMDNRADSAGQSRVFSLASSSHQTTDGSATRQNELTASASSVSLSSSSGREQLLELEHKRKSSRLSSMRHQTRKRIEMEHLMELQAKLRTINAHLRQENQTLRNLVQRFREVVSMKEAQGANPTSAQANPRSAPAQHQPSNPVGLSNADPKPFINNVMALFEVLNDSEQLSAQYEVQGQRQSGLIPPPAPAAQQPPATIRTPPTTPRLPQSLEMELMQQRLHQTENFPYAHASRTLHPASLPYAAAASSVVQPNPRGAVVQPSSLNLLDNYSFWQQQGAFGVALPPNTFLPAQLNTGVQLNVPIPGLPRVLAPVAEGAGNEEDEEEDEEDAKPKAQRQEQV